MVGIDMKIVKEKILTKEPLRSNGLERCNINCPECLLRYFSGKPHMPRYPGQVTHVIIKEMISTNWSPRCDWLERYDVDRHENLQWCSKATSSLSRLNRTLDQSVLKSFIRLLSNITSPYLLKKTPSWLLEDRFILRVIKFSVDMTKGSANWGLLYAFFRRESGILQ